MSSRFTLRDFNFDGFAERSLIAAIETQDRWIIQAFKLAIIFVRYHIREVFLVLFIYPESFLVFLVADVSLYIFLATTEPSSASQLC